MTFFLNCLTGLLEGSVAQYVKYVFQEYYNVFHMFLSSYIYITKKKHAFFVRLSTFSISRNISKIITVTEKIIIELGFKNSKKIIGRRIFEKEFDFIS